MPSAPVEVIEHLNDTSDVITKTIVEQINQIIDERFGTESDISDEEIEAAIAALHSDVTLSATTV